MINKYLISFCFSVIILSAWGQGQILNSEIIGKSTVIDPQKITMKEHFIAQKGCDFVAKIGPLSSNLSYQSVPTSYPTINLGGVNSTRNKQNYIQTMTPRIPLDDISSGVKIDELNIDYQYFDGFGRSLETVSQNASPNQKDMIQFVEYDLNGRQNKTFLPYELDNTSNNGNYIDIINAKTQQQSFYSSYNEGNFTYAETRFENSPLNRVILQGAPGISWDVDGTHPIEMVYASNSASQNVKLWKANQKKLLHSPSRKY